MAARVGIRREDVLAAALDILAQLGEDALSLSEVARRLGIRTQSLYAHVDGVEGLRRALAIHGLERIRDAATDAALGVEGPDAVAAVVRAHLAVATEAPSLYDIAIHPPGTASDFISAVRSAGEPLQKVLRSSGLVGEDATHWTRLMLSTVAGYSRLCSGGRFALSANVTRTEDRLVAMLVSTLHTVSSARPFGDQEDQKLRYESRQIFES